MRRPGKETNCRNIIENQRCSYALVVFINRKSSVGTCRNAIASAAKKCRGCEQRQKAEGKQQASNSDMQIGPRGKVTPLMFHGVPMSCYCFGFFSPRFSIFVAFHESVVVMRGKVQGQPQRQRNTFFCLLYGLPHYSVFPPRNSSSESRALRHIHGDFLPDSLNGKRTQHDCLVCRVWHS